MGWKLQAAQKGPREQILYLPAIVPDASRPDYLVTIDVDPQSETYQQVVHTQIPMTTLMLSPLPSSAVSLTQGSNV